MSKKHKVVLSLSSLTDDFEARISRKRTEACVVLPNVYELITELTDRHQQGSVKLLRAYFPGGIAYAASKKQTEADVMEIMGAVLLVPTLSPSRASLSLYMHSEESGYRYLPLKLLTISLAAAQSDLMPDLMLLQYREAKLLT